MGAIIEIFKVLKVLVQYTKYDKVQTGPWDT